MRTTIDDFEKDMPRWRNRRHRRQASRFTYPADLSAPLPAGTAPDTRLTDDQRELLELASEVERARAGLHEAARQLLSFVNTHPGLRDEWDQFIGGGGTSADELRRLLLGKLRPTARKLPRRGLVRLVISNEPRPKSGKYKPSQNPPLDAA